MGQMDGWMDGWGCGYFMKKCKFLARYLSLAPDIFRHDNIKKIPQIRSFVPRPFLTSSLSTDQPTYLPYIAFSFHSSVCRSLSFSLSFFFLLFLPTCVLSLTQPTNQPTNHTSPIFHIKQAIFRLLCNSELPTLMRVFSPAQAYASTIHSYQTFVSSVWRHMLTSSSVSWGKQRGFCFCFVFVSFMVQLAVVIFLPWGTVVHQIT